jgi:hypothetical protein
MGYVPGLLTAKVTRMILISKVRGAQRLLIRMINDHNRAAPARHSLPCLQ